LSYISNSDLNFPVTGILELFDYSLFGVREGLDTAFVLVYIYHG